MSGTVIELKNFISILNQINLVNGLNIVKFIDKNYFKS